MGEAAPKKLLMPQCDIRSYATELDEVLPDDHVHTFMRREAMPQLFYEVF